MLHPHRRGQPYHTGAFIVKNSRLPLALAFSTPPGSAPWTNATAPHRLQQSHSRTRTPVTPVTRPGWIHAERRVYPFFSMAN